MEICFFTCNPEAQVSMIQVYEGETKELDPRKVFEKARNLFKLEFHDVDATRKITDDQAIMQLMIPDGGFVRLLQDGERLFAVSRGWTKQLHFLMENAPYPAKIRREFLKAPRAKKTEE